MEKGSLFSRSLKSDSVIFWSLDKPRYYDDMPALPPDSTVVMANNTEEPKIAYRCPYCKLLSFNY